MPILAASIVVIRADSRPEKNKLTEGFVAASELDSDRTSAAAAVVRCDFRQMRIKKCFRLVSLENE